jgi:hypothetical protein
MQDELSKGGISRSRTPGHVIWEDPFAHRRPRGLSEAFASRSVKDLVADSGLTFEDAGEHKLKGIPGRWHVYRIGRSSC